jgi:hypothetical protein
MLPQKFITKKKERKKNSAQDFIITWSEFQTILRKYRMYNVLLKHFLVTHTFQWTPLITIIFPQFWGDFLLIWRFSCTPLIGGKWNS